MGRAIKREAVEPYLKQFIGKRPCRMYNIFRAVIVVQHDQDGKMRLYDMMNIKKRARFSGPKNLLSNKTHFLVKQ